MFRTTESQATGILVALAAFFGFVAVVVLLLDIVDIAPYGLWLLPGLAALFFGGAALM